MTNIGQSPCDLLPLEPFSCLSSSSDPSPSRWSLLFKDAATAPKKANGLGLERANSLTKLLMPRPIQSAMSFNGSKQQGIITPPPPRKPADSKSSPDGSRNLLHLACLKPDLMAGTIEQLIRSNPEAVSRSIQLRSPKTTYNPIARKRIIRPVAEKYTYPLHLAIHHNASARVIVMLMDADPSMLMVRDGRQQETPIQVLLKSRRIDEQASLVDQMMLEDPGCVAVTDRLGNTALHVALAQGNVQNLDILKHVIVLHPNALEHRNSLGKTPMDICQQKSTVSSEAASQLIYERTRARQQQEILDV